MDTIQTAVNYRQLPRPTWAEIDLDAIENNIDAFLDVLGKDVSLIVAAKGNGYGHGMLPIVKLLESKDIYGFATGNIYEAIQMRKGSASLSNCLHTISRKPQGFWQNTA